MRRVLVLTAIVSLCLGPMSVARAHEQKVEDGNDTQGRLDIDWASLAHQKAGEDTKLVLRMRTHERFRASHLRSSGNIFFNFKISQDSLTLVEIDDHGEGIQGAIIPCAGGECDYSNVQIVDVTRPNKKSVRTSVLLDDIFETDNNVRWKVQTGFGTGCGGSCYFDNAPNSGYATHDVAP